MKKVCRLLIFFLLMNTLFGCTSSEIGILGTPMGLTDLQNEIMDIVMEMAENRIKEYCEVPDMNETYSMIGTPAEPCDYQKGVNYYVSDPLFVFNEVEDEITRRADFEAFVMFREEDAIYFTNRNLTDGYSEKSNKTIFTEIFQSEENFVLLITDGNLWMITENSEILLHLGSKSPGTIDGHLVKTVRKKILTKYQYSFYKHIISFDE